MSSRSPYTSRGAELADSLTPGIRALLVANGVVFLLQTILPALRLLPSGWIEQTFGLVSSDVFARGHVWQLATYLFLHGGLMHLLFNMLGLWMFGSEIERSWGTRAFLTYYFFTGIGAGITTWLVCVLTHSPGLTIGASGAVFGILLAFGMLFPDRQILLYFVIPIQAKYLVILYGFIELLSVAGGRMDGVARFAHLGGMLWGFVYLKSERFGYPLRRWWGTRRKAVERQRMHGEAQRRQADQDRKDAILDKIAREGMGSLSREERKFLEDAARRGREGRG